MWFCPRGSGEFAASFLPAHHNKGAAGQVSLLCQLLLFNQRMKGLINKKGVQKVGTSRLAKRLGTAIGWSLTTHYKHPCGVTKEQLLMEVREHEEQGGDMSSLSSRVQVQIERFLAVKQLFAGLHSMLRG